MRRTLVLGLAACGLTLAACSSSPSSSTTTASSTPSGGSSTSQPGGSSSMPAVTNATDLNTAPTIGAGTPPPPTTLQTKDLVVGTGQEASPTSTVTVQYVGADYATGKTFDSSWSRGQPATFSLNGGVIPGFAQGIAGMKVGGRREIVIPAPLGYGSSPPAGAPISVNENLVFVVDLKAVS